MTVRLLPDYSSVIVSGSGVHGGVVGRGRPFLRRGRGLAGG